MLDYKLSPVSNALLFIFFLFALFGFGSTTLAHFTSDVSINCGSIAASAARNGHQWLGDEQPKLSSLLQINGKSTTSTPTNILTSEDPVPHETGRISRSKFSYAFQVEPGQRIIRLHFNPSPYKGFRDSNDLFTVQSGRFTLLRNFSASLTAAALAVNTLTKEFCLHIQENQQRLTITFSPETSQTPDAYAFINGIEIVVVPAALSYFGVGDIDIGLQVVGEKSRVYVDNNTALEIIQRQNLKQDPVSLNGDSSDNIFPKWATQDVDKMKNSTWKVPVKVGFRYLVRLHFSEVGLKIVGTGELIFKVLINEMIAQTNSDILRTRDGNYFVLYRDYIVMMPGLKTDTEREILISILSHDELRDRHDVLVGFEIVKLSNHDNSLASPNPLPRPQRSTSTSTRYLSSVLGRFNANSTLAVAILCLINIIVYTLRDIWVASSTKEEMRPSGRAERLFLHFSLREIQIATEYFYEGHVIGKGGFGKVYKGMLRGIDVAIKRLKSDSRQGECEFLTEIQTLSELRHINLVSLIGYCKEGREMILVYEYMPKGTLADHLYKITRRNRNCTSLTWKQRLNICIEAGRGLDYLHTGHRIIHRDVKASNILLDEKFVAKVSDFGLAKAEDRSRLQSHVSTRVKGTFGYFDPYYMTTQRLTKKSDTYAFGVVLFEVLCGRPTIDSRVSEEKRVLITWVRDKISKREVEDIVDSSLKQEIVPDSLKTFVEVAEKCLHDEPKNRPTMSQVVLQLESALEQQGNRILALVNHITPVARDKNPSNEDILTQSGSSQQSSRAASTYTPSFILSPAIQSNLSSSPSNTKESSKLNKLNLLRFLACCTYRRRAKPQVRKGQASSTETFEGGTIMRQPDPTRVEVAVYQSSDMCRYFSLHEIKKAIEASGENKLLGRGGFRNVYKGLIDGTTIVAIKRLSSRFQQRANEFRAQMQLFSELRHCHLVSLIGYCNEKEAVMLVYEYMAHGSLQDHLYISENSLTWKQRLQICLGAAKGLDYLHTGTKYGMIHRDVKTANILLDEKWVAKISDFGVFRELYPDREQTQTYVSTYVVGTLDYLDPEYYMNLRLTDKSDVYSFGVVLLEVLSARKPIIPSLPRKQVNLINWGISCFRKGKLDRIVDPNLKGQIAPKSLNKFVETAVACVRGRGIDRLNMRDVIECLELTMQLQEAAAIDEGNLSKPVEFKDQKTFEGGTIMRQPDPTRVEVAVYQSSNMCRYFSLHEINKAIDAFGENKLLGREGFRNVYKGLIDGTTIVAIKRLSSRFHQRANGFRPQMQLFSELRHCHLVSLIGYCNEKEAVMLVYEYMAHGSLQDHLYSTENSLTWKQRLQICLGAAKGLDYLHNGTKYGMIHRDVKTANILLDEKWVAKISDFSVSRELHSDWEQIQTHVTTYVVGTFGYLDPEYYVNMRLTVKSDVYSFGVVLLEVLSARKPIIPSLPRKQVNLINWGISCFRKGKLDRIVDPNLEGQIAPKSLNKFVETAVACVSGRGIDRPDMRDVIECLELTMQLQEATAIDEAVPRPLMIATTSQVDDLNESKYPSELSEDSFGPLKGIKI